MIDTFDGKYQFLSNFYDSPILYFDGLTYPTVEHCFQAQKTLDLSARYDIVLLDTPGKAKRAGRQVALRSDWEDIKLSIMERCLRLKFSDPELAQMLLDTGDEELVEGNWWHDTYWGVCQGEGENNLGKLLMKIRDEKRKEVKG